MCEIIKVSIVLPVYNGERFLMSAIDSILAQSFRDFELIVVDDSSTDRSHSIISEYLKQDHRVKLITNDRNRGLPYSLNRGFSIARGEYFTWTSDDNLYYEDALGKMVAFLDANKKCGLVYAGMNLINERSEVIGKRCVNDGNIYRNNCVGACFLYRRECKNKIGDYDESRYLVEDYDYWLRISEFYLINRLPEVLYDYRYHSHSLTMKKMKQVNEQLASLHLNYIQRISDNVDEDTFEGIVFEVFVCMGDRAASKFDAKMTKKMSFVFDRNKEIRHEKFWLFGAGEIGRAAMDLLDNTRVIGYVDNDKNKIGEHICGKPIVSLEHFLEAKSTKTIVVSTELRNAYSIIRQLNSVGVNNAILLFDLL